MDIKFEKKGNITFVVSPRGIITICTIIYVTEDNGEKKAIFTPLKEKFFYKVSS